MPSDPNSEEDVQEVANEALQIKKNLDAMESRGHIERVVTLGNRIQRRSKKKFLSLKPVPFTYQNVS